MYKLTSCNKFHNSVICHVKLIDHYSKGTYILTVELNTYNKNTTSRVKIIPPKKLLKSLQSIIPQDQNTYIYDYKTFPGYKISILLLYYKLENISQDGIFPDLLVILNENRVFYDSFPSRKQSGIHDANMSFRFAIKWNSAEINK